MRAALDDLDAGQNAAVPDTGTLRGDLLAVMANLRERATEPYLAMIADLVAAQRHDAQLAAELRVRLANEELSPRRGRCWTATRPSGGRSPPGCWG